MKFKIGDLVTRNSYNNDLLFRIKSINNDVSILEGVNIRLIADSNISDLSLYNESNDDDIEFLKRIEPKKIDRDDYFYLPGKILHIDADKEYLNRCMNFYEKSNIWAKGILESEKNISSKIIEYLEEYRPDIVVITGHDAYLKKRGSDLNSYKNSLYFVDAIKEARKYEKSHEKLIIIAGGCQSNYEELIKAGANFASSPKRVNIHALDPAIIASTISLSDITKDIDLKGILDKTKYGSSGMGGIKTKGTMYIGYPR
ncbi:MAG: sporulation peptidase YabG [Bacilli bacterium]|nr:sporulation peptidase YabG [Bacilli bacterium]